MSNKAHSHEVGDLTESCDPHLFKLPNELLFKIVRFSLAVGRERDASALARTCKWMHERLNPELYKLVIKYRTFYIVHWAASRGRTETLKIAFANGADPNHMWTSNSPISIRPISYRPVGWGLETAEKLDLAVWRQRIRVRAAYNRSLASMRWPNVFFSSVSLSKANRAQMHSLCNHYSVYPRTSNTHDVRRAWLYSLDRGMAIEEARNEVTDDRLLNDLSEPLADGFTFPENMSPTDMDREDVKRGFLRAFRYWTHPLHFAALHDRPAVAEALLANGANLDSTTVELCLCSSMISSSLSASLPRDHLAVYTPLHVAICSGSWATARVLIAHGAHRMAKIFSGNNDRRWLPETPLHTALSSHRHRGLEYYEFIEFLLNQGYATQIEQRNYEGRTPLLIACDGIDDPCGHAVVELLLRYGADIETQGPCIDFDRYFATSAFPTGVHEWATPALWASRRGRFRLAKLLLDQGADPKTKSSAMRVTMLHAVCSRAGFRGAVLQDRTDLFEHLLANSTAKDLNAFDGTGCTPLTLLIQWELWIDYVPGIDVMKSRLFRKGADIMAGIQVGKETPFETLIKQSLAYPTFNIEDPENLTSYTVNKVLATLRIFQINGNPHRPTAFLNQFWGYLGRALGTLMVFGPSYTREMVPMLLHALIKCGFRPAEFDRHGNNAMTSFLKFLLSDRELVWCDKTSLGADGWLIQSIMALLQENGAGLHVRNHEGNSAFDYLHMIVNEGRGASESLASVVGRQVQIGLDQHGKLCFKFHPTKHSLGKLSVGNFLHTIQGDPSRWLVCEHWCRRHCGSSGAANWQCRCARTSFQTFARCDGECCQKPKYTLDQIRL